MSLLDSFRFRFASANTEACAGKKRQENGDKGARMPNNRKIKNKFQCMTQHLTIEAESNNQGHCVQFKIENTNIDREKEAVRHTETNLPLLILVTWITLRRLAGIPIGGHRTDKRTGGSRVHCS